MTIKLVQGLVDRSGFSSSPKENPVGDAAKAAPQSNASVVAQQQSTSAVQTAVTSVRSTEAVFTTLRSTRVASQGERLTPKEAQEFANNLAQRIREEETADVPSHSKLEYLVAGDHLK